MAGAEGRWGSPVFSNTLYAKPGPWQQDEISEPISRMRIRASKGQSHQTSKCSVDAGGWGGVPEEF